MTEKSELTSLCDEIARMIPSYNLKDTATSQFKEFIDKLRVNKIKEPEIKAIVQAYNYFNQLMGSVGDMEDTKDTQEKPGGETGVNPGGKPGGETGVNPGGKPGGETGVNPGVNPGVKPGGETGVNPGGEPGGKPGGKPGGETDETTENEPTQDTNEEEMIELLLNLTEGNESEENKEI
jgi:hypothetical protein